MTNTYLPPPQAIVYEDGGARESARAEPQGASVTVPAKPAENPRITFVQDAVRMAAQFPACHNERVVLDSGLAAGDVIALRDPTEKRALGPAASGGGEAGK